MKRTIRMITLLLLFSMCFSFMALAAADIPVMPCSSKYLSSYGVRTSHIAGTLNLQICFTVSGTNVLDEIGTTRIVLQRSSDGIVWNPIKTFLPTAYPRMLATNKAYYTSHVDYTAASGYYYRAYITIWGGKDGGGDSRYVYTNVVDLKGANP